MFVNSSKEAVKIKSCIVEWETAAASEEAVASEAAVTSETAVTSVRLSINWGRLPRFPFSRLFGLAGSGSAHLF